MGTHSQVFKVPHLPVRGNVRIVGNKFFDSSAALIFSHRIVSEVLVA
jgi:hypothetical protein